MRLIKRTLFNEYSQTKQLNSCTEAIKGIYSAIRLNDVCCRRPDSRFTVLTVKQSFKSGGGGLGVNVDVSNQTFWVGQKFEQLARNFLGCMDRKWENSECIY
jgi:eukaryotic translation initiation factor 2C